MKVHINSLYLYYIWEIDPCYSPPSLHILAIKKLNMCVGIKPYGVKWHYVGYGYSRHVSWRMMFWWIHFNCFIVYDIIHQKRVYCNCSLSRLISLTIRFRPKRPRNRHSKSRKNIDIKKTNINKEKNKIKRK